MAGKVAKKMQFLVTDKSGKGHLPVTGENGKPNHRLMGAAWAALFSPGGHRGNKYEGPDKEKAKKKLKQLYAREGLDTPAEKAETRDELLKGWTTDAINNVAYGRLGKGMYTVGRFAEIIDAIKYLWLGMEYEMDAEGDEVEASESVEGVKEAYLQLLEHLITYTEEQVAEAREHPKLAEVD